MKVHLIHGIRTAGTSPIQGLASFLGEFDVRYPDYGWIFGLETRVVNPLIVGTLRPYIERGDIIIGHSNGCAIAYDLMNAGCEFGGAVFINAALKQDIKRPGTIPWIDVYYNAGDTITEIAQIGAELGIDDPVWGEMGHAGYVGSDTHVTNVDCGATAGLPAVRGHSAFFLPGNLKAWGPEVARRLREHLQRS